MVEHADAATFSEFAAVVEEIGSELTRAVLGLCVLRPLGTIAQVGDDGAFLFFLVIPIIIIIWSITVSWCSIISSGILIIIIIIIIVVVVFL